MESQIYMLDGWEVSNNYLLVTKDLDEPSSGRTMNK